MVKFDNLSDASNLGKFNQHLADKSYVEGFIPSSSDVEHFKQLTSAPDAGKFAHVSRWWHHIASFTEAETKSWGAATATAAPAKASDDDFDLFGDETDAEREAEIERRAAAEMEKKKAKGGPALKSAVIIDVKVWEAETDMKDLEEKVRSIEMPGLEWKASKLVAIGFGVKKLQIMAHVEDERVSVDDLCEKIQAFEDLVQSTDIDTFTKL